MIELQRKSRPVTAHYTCMHKHAAPSSMEVSSRQRILGGERGHLLRQRRRLRLKLRLHRRLERRQPAQKRSALSGWARTRKVQRATS